MGFRRRPFRDLVRRQLDLFSEAHGPLVDEAEQARAAWARAGRADAEERYADYLDAAGDARDELASMRDAYAASLDSDQAARYCNSFDREVVRRWPCLVVDPDAGLFDDLEEDGERD